MPMSSQLTHGFFGAFVSPSNNRAAGCCKETGLSPIRACTATALGETIFGVTGSGVASVLKHVARRDEATASF